MSEEAVRPHLAFVGMAGSGKSTVAVGVAHALGLPLVDLDDEVAQHAGASLGEIFTRDGEVRFRELEAAALRSVLDLGAPTVVATGGGAVLRSENREVLGRRSTCVYLRADVATLTARVQSDTTERPLLADDSAGVLARLLGDRAALYEEVADITVDVDDADPPAVVDVVLRALVQRRGDAVVAP